MKKTQFEDIADMHQKFGVNQVVDTMPPSKLLPYLKFRLDMCREELEETEAAFECQDAEEIVDGLIDLMVFAAGTLDVMGVDAQKAWSAVHEANMSKDVGVKEGRPNPFGFPDMIKPSDWVAPSHEGNHGIIPYVFSEDN